ncbi:MAG: hypothetical protein JW904_08955 [Spirochaetales bacterium]|nr:hypothetical protein [Spirochaetales bacterium]
MTTGIKKILFILFLGVVAAGAGFCEGTAEDRTDFGPGSPEVRQALDKQGLVIIPESYLRGYDPITVFFSSDVGPKDGGPLDNPKGLLEISPPHPGEYRFIDSRTLQFLPAEGWPALRSYTIRSKNVARILSTLMVPPSSISPSSGSKELEPIKKLSLAFQYPVGIAELAEMISFEEKDLPGVGAMASSWLTGKDFTLKVLDRRSEKEPARYELTFHNPITYGKQLTMYLRLAKDEKIQGSLATYTFSTKQEFKIASVGAGYFNLPVSLQGSSFNLEQAFNCGSGKTPLFIEFTENLQSPSIETVKRMVHFEPAVRDLTFDISGKKLYLYFTVDRETPYKLTVTWQPLKSRTGRSLSAFGDSSFYFYYTQNSAYLQWKKGEAIVERYGPKHFPMQGRGITQVDLRIYKIDAESRNFWPFPNQPFAIDEESRPPMPGEEPEYGQDLQAQIRLLGSPHVSQIIALPITEKSGSSLFGLDLAPYLQRISGVNEPGTYLIGYRLLGSTTRRIYVRMTVTDIALSTIEEEHAVNFVVTSLSTGKPLAGAEVTIDGEEKYNEPWIPVISGITDNTGQYRYQHTAKLKGTIKRIRVKYRGDELVLDPNTPPQHFMNNHWFGAGGRWLSWVNSEPRQEKESARRRGYIFTERPVYRPEEPVHIMGYVRLLQQGKITADDAGRKRYVIVTAPGYKQWSYPVTLTGNGTFYVKFDEKDLPTGDYSAVIRDDKSGENLSTINFKKEAYRVPRFEATITGPDRVPVDREFSLTLTADYYAGGRVVGQQVIWEITKYPYTIRPKGLPGFIFSTDESFSGGRIYAYDGATTKRDVTDDNGSAILKINPAIEQAGVPRRYVIEGTVQGADAQTVTAVKQVLAVPSFAIGLKVDRFVKDSKIIKPEVIIIDHDEKPLSGKELTVRLYHREWHSYLSESDFTTGQVKYHTDVVDKVIQETKYTSRGEPLVLTLPVDNAGVYIVEVIARDNLGRLQKLQQDLYVAGDTPVSWKKAYANVFETSLDKKIYAPGESANILLKSPFQDARALIVVEGPSKNDYYWVDVKNGQGIFTLPVTKDMVPRIPVHALLIRGRLPDTGDTFTGRVDRGKPIAMANTTWVDVDSVQHKAKLTLEHASTALPGTKMTMKLKLTDAAGRPANGEVALWLVDRAVLALGEEKSLNPLSAFIDPVYAYLRFRETRNEVVGNIPLEELPGGGGWDDEAGRAMSKEEMADRLFKKTTVRKNFQTVPYFNPKIDVRNGYAEITIDLPENLTDFAVRAIATVDTDKFGTATSVISIRLPLIVQSALPRFVRPGDTFLAGGIGRVVEGDAGPGTVAVEVENIQLSGKETQKRDSRAVQWKPKLAEKLYFPFKVPKSISYEDDKEVTIRIAVDRTSDGASDGFEKKLPVQFDNKMRRIEKLSSIDSATALKMPVPGVAPRSGTVRQMVVLTYEPEMVKLLQSMYFLKTYVHGCTEQRVSKIYPNIALKDALTQIGLAEEYKVSDADFADLMAYLETTLTESGLYSFWPGSTGYVSLTSYVVEFLVAARDSGLTVPAKLLDRPIQALRRALRSDYNYFVSGQSFRERVEALSALAAARQFEDQYAYQLLVGAQDGDLYTKAKILRLFLTNKKQDNSDVKTLQKQVWDSTVFRKRGADELFEGFQYKNDSWGGLVLSSEIRTTAEIIRALYRENPDNRRVQLMTDYLVQKGDSAGWGSTSNNVSALLAFADILGQRTAQSQRKHTFRFTYGGKTAEIDTNGRNTSLYQFRSDSPGIIEYVSGDKNNMPSAWLVVDYIPEATGDLLPAENNGFVVERELLEYGEDKKLKARRKPEKASRQTYEMETIIEEHVTVINGETRNFVAVMVPFAAGFEIMNPALATSSKDAQPLGRLTANPSYTYYGDDQVIFYYDTLQKGTYEFYFRIRASFEGEYSHPPASAELMYDLNTSGRSDGTKIVIIPKNDGK